MASHINYPATTVGGKLLAEATAALIDARAKWQRLKLLADAVSSGGGQSALLESDTTFSLPANSGSVVYTNISQFVVALNGLTALSDTDLGS